MSNPVELSQNVPTMLESLHNARNAAIAGQNGHSRVNRPKKGQTVFSVDVDGNYLDSGTIVRKPGPTYVSVKSDTSGRTSLFTIEGLNRLSPDEWSRTVSIMSI